MKDLAAILAIVDYKRPRLTRLPSLSFLAFLAGLSEEDLFAAFGRLKELNYIRISGTTDEMEISIDGLLAAIERETASDREPKPAGDQTTNGADSPVDLPF